MSELTLALIKQLATEQDLMKEEFIQKGIRIFKNELPGVFENKQQIEPVVSRENMPKKQSMKKPQTSEAPKKADTQTKSLKEILTRDTADSDVNLSSRLGDSKREEIKAAVSRPEIMVPVTIADTN
jgi:hypothetical protein